MAGLYSGGRSFIQCRKFLQEASNRNVLRTDVFTFAAFQTLRSFCVIHGKALIVHICFLTGNRMQIKQAKVIRNIDADRAFFQTVSAAGTWHFDRLIENGCNLIDKIAFRLGQRFEFLHVGGIVVKLLQ